MEHSVHQVALSVVGFAAATFLTTGVVAASPDEEAESSEFPLFGAGVRIGGLGFRHTENEKLRWNECRMNGTGIFATVDFGENLFAELGFDYYHATGKAVAAGMDRLSFYILPAVGVRFLRDYVVTPYFQAGVGPEWTQFDDRGRTVTKTWASPFVGLGGEVELGEVRLGSHIRSYAMGLPLHGGGDHSNGGGDEVTVRYEAAGQVQFFVRHVF